MWSISGFARMASLAGPFATEPPLAAAPRSQHAVKLTPERDARVREILSARRTAARSTLEQLRQAQQELADRLLAPGEVQAADIQPQLQQIGQLREQLLQGSAQVALEVRAVLTPEQLARAVQVRTRLQQLRGEMRQLFEPARP